MKIKPGFRLCICLILFILVPLNSTVKAQATGLSVVPSESYIYLNGSNTASVTLYVTNAVDLQAFELEINYDPTLVQLASWAHGGFLGSSLFPLVVEDLPGYLHLAFTKMGPPGGSGNGDLLILTFSGVGYGISPVTIESAEFTNGQGQYTYPVLSDGTIECTYASSPIVIAILSGEISLQGTSERGGIPVSMQMGLFVGQGPYSTVSLAQPGQNLFFDSVAWDAYPLITNYPRTLNLDASAQKIKGVVGTVDTLTPLLLLAGNVVDSDNEIDSEDMDLISLWFDLTLEDIKPGDPLLGDANFDGVVDIRDLALAGGNFGLNGATAYLDWMP